MGDRAGAELARTLTLALDSDVTFEQDAMLYRIAHGQTSLASFLERFGHRCIGEMELSQPRWREQADYLEQTIARLSGAGRSPEEIHEQAVQRYSEARAKLPETLKHWGGSCFREAIERDLQDARALLPYREAGKYYLMMGYEIIRATLQELARRWDLGRDLYFLRWQELPRFVASRSQLVEVMAQRRLRWQALQKLDLPDLVDSAHLESLGQPPPLDASQMELTGTAMAPGVASGLVRVVHNPQEPGELGMGYVLVCPSTDPGWTPLFMQARGLVVERGGVLSHGAIVARDFGIPAVACPNATRLLKPGSLVRVDGNAGRVILMDDQPQQANQHILKAVSRDLQQGNR